MKILSMPKGAPSELKIYDNGTWSVPYDNDPSHWTTSFNKHGAVLNPTNIVLNCNSSQGAIIGTANAIDLTSYSMLKIKAQASDTFGYGIFDSKDTSAPHTLAYSTVPANSGQTEYTIDISALTSGYFAVQGGDGANRTLTITEITLA